MLNRQAGIASVEFAIGGVVFFIVLFAVIELGRGLFTWNGLTEATRRGARVAAVCPINHSAIRRIALFDTPTSVGESPTLSGLTNANFILSYLDENGAPVADPAVTGFGLIRYVQVAISGYQFSLNIPFASTLITAPDFVTTLPRESLGIPRDGVIASCFGTAS